MRKLIMGLAVSSMILTACNKAPELGMIVPTTGVAGENVAMTSGGDIKKAYNVNWSFGDGGSAATFDANHTYSEAGTYTVTLTATNRKGSNATTATSIITISDNGIDAVETKMEEEAVAMDAWWTKAAGTWSFGTGSTTFTGCGTSSANSDKRTADTRSQAIKVTIVDQSVSYYDSYYKNENGEVNSYSFDAVDADHVSVGSLRYLFVNTDNNVNDHSEMAQGIYKYTNTGSVITLTREEESINTFNGTDKPCVEKTVYTYTLTK
ncbi:MAG: PKD repeat protein [Salibacteraceae bacterium]|jgi:PKD repeat protein|tara:strand:+ start:2524 stop:3318 length:795 start_codon:yes stop_codon:yes gene_type:complete